MADHSLEVGADLHTYCTKCKTDTWHVIVAKVGTGKTAKIKRVECKICGSLHNLREKQETPAHKRGSIKKKATKKKAISRKAALRETGESDADQWQGLVNDRESAGEDQQSYSMGETFQVGNLIDHKKFGLGVVVQILDNYQKVEIVFKAGAKLLVMGR